MQESTDKGISIEDAATRLGISLSTARRLIKNGDLPAVKVSARRIVVMDSELAKYTSTRAAVPA